MAIIKQEIFSKTFTTAPKVVSPAITALCREVSPQHQPLLVPVRPEPSATIGECFNNVNQKIGRDGGTIAYGWLIWEWPRVIVEAEHHAVWDTGGALIDITPHVHNESDVLFLPDPRRAYDYKSQKRLLNVKRSLGEFKSVDAWIAANDTLQQMMEQCSVGNEIRMNRDLFKRLSNDKLMAGAAVLVDLAANTKVNAPCFCSSGKKFKKCCARLIDLTAR
ncbi:SEC-C metal-binding domain-containing protein [Bradyrhizobium sp. CIAT3101]|uniref:SEC-C metal-binding domain-containing protein n=1 Tax=Bradyrhizobium sp. CIAT3101 TaxID=439387 RepID=UPI0024B13A3C|nr:SEC-C metal-binding domain-containing protein [Bradyrhizobium sp. CIAT3101]WFU79396.1 SEC-C metal-binding domain-containing protein [Bradyrhizobium sp. CIAT3101]